VAVRLDASRRLSQQLPRAPTEDLGLRAADLFSWGTFRKHERNDAVWFDVFRPKVRHD